MDLVEVKKNNPGNSHRESNGRVLTQKQVTRTFPPQTAAHNTDWMTERHDFAFFPPYEADSLTKSLAVHGFTRKQPTLLSKNVK